MLARGALNVVNSAVEKLNDTEPGTGGPQGPGPTGSARDDRARPFYAALDGALARRGLALHQICPPHDLVARRVLEEYGAVFMACEAVQPPPVCIFTDEAEVARFQAAAGWAVAEMAGARIELQPAALAALLAARAEARRCGLEITPRDGAEAARRRFDDTLRLWLSRVLPALDHWTAEGRLAPDEAARVRELEPRKQVAAVLELEASGIFFSKDFSKSILRSVAAPGASQHLSMLAFDVAEFSDERVRRILAGHGWFQTVNNDLPHFTFLGLEEDELPARGLKRIETKGQFFWIPDV